jgi:predicted nucleic acid-binding protein
MTSVVLDASAVLRFLDDEAGAETVEHLLHRAAAGDLEIFISAVNWGEVVYAVAHRQGVDAARQLVNALSSLQLKIISSGPDEATEAAFFKARFKIPFADAFAASLAVRKATALVTADYDFKAIPASVLKVEFLPAKSKRRA